MKNTFFTKNIISNTISAAFIFLFVYAAGSKIQDFDKFQIQLGKSPILSSWNIAISFAVPSLELLMAGFLFFRQLQILALYACFSLMVIFTTYIVIILNFSPYIPCSCGGILENMSWESHLRFNVVFIILALIGVLIHPTEKLINNKG